MSEPKAKKGQTMSEPIVDTMELWRQVCQTDPDFTKNVNQRGGFTAINATWQIKQATMQWGPYGSTWKLSYAKEHLTIGSKMAVLYAIFQYPSGEFPISNAIDIMDRKGNYDTDFIKKLETDTLTKALSKLGFSADIFMGCWDQQKYTADAYQHQSHQPQQNTQGYQQ